MHSTLRKAFILEAIANTGTLPLLTHTRTILPYLLVSPAQLTPATVLFARMFSGLVVFVLTPLLLLGTRTRETQKLAYYCLALGEGIWIPLLLVEALKGGDAAKGAALTPFISWSMVGTLTAAVLWRVYVLAIRPDMLSKSVETKGR